MEIRTCCDICGFWPTYHGLKPTALKSACFELPSRSPPLSPRKPLRCGIINSNDSDNKLIRHHHHHDRHGRHRHRQNDFRGHGVARTATFALKTTSSQECLSIMPRKSVSQHGLTRVFQDCATRVSVLQECAARVSHANGSRKFCSRVSVYIYIIYVHTCLYVYIYLHIDTYIYIYICVCVCVFAHMYIYIYI